jgi:hypothetical protein
METGCEAAKEFALLWEAKGGCPELEAGIGAFRGHLASCPECRLRFGLLVPLIERDSSAAPHRKPDELFVARVMGAVPDRPISHRPQRRRALIPAAAAALVLLGGFAIARAGVLSRGGDLVSIHFTLDAPNASSVLLVGSFSDWSVDDRFRMQRAPKGDWELVVRLKKAELYSYGFLIDGEKWLPDPKAAETVDDGFGGANSLLRL